MKGKNQMLTTTILLLSLFFVKSALANPACAVCTIAVGASLEIARSLGVDDSVVGVWAGAFLVLIGYWTIKWFDKKNWHFKGRNFWILTISVAMIGFIYISEMKYHAEVIGILYLDPFLFSVLVGAAVIILSSRFYQWMKERNGGHAHFPFEKVVLPVAALALTSAYFNYFPICQHVGGDLYSF